MPVHPEKSRPSFFWPLAALVIPPLTAIARFEVIDRDKLPLSGAFILAPNHYSEIDPVIVAAVAWKLGRAPRFLTKASLFRVPVVGWFLAKSGQIPVERAGATRKGAPLQAAQKLVDSGQIVIIYPEGTLTRDPELWPMRGKTGAARMALEHDLPVIPVAHWGTQQVMARYSKKVSLVPRKTITIKFGDPVDLSAYRGKPLDSTVAAAATNDIMQAITALLEDLRGEKAPPERWDPAAHHQSETGRFES
ncbi:MAG TPA: lysophospholipid acyltransferase family protein [Microbacteriaceae bacterium]|nr:lysophospholipid acyltransferase family protein [Microbacteriaceae bacterium]